jgi:hypothetical protein
MSCTLCISFFFGTVCTSKRSEAGRKQGKAGRQNELLPKCYFSTCHASFHPGARSNLSPETNTNLMIFEHFY